MWPRLFSRGDFVREVKIEAKSTLQCGHGFSAVEIRSLYSMGPGPGQHRFNVATAFQPWRCDSHIRHSFREAKLQCGHGFSAVEMVWTRDTSLAMLEWLQCGHGFSAVEMASVGCWVSLRKRLQCGHGFSAVEIGPSQGRTACHPAASMWPRLFSRGDIGNTIQPGVWAHASMWPRLFSRGDVAYGFPFSSGWRCFNVATAFQPWRYQALRLRAYRQLCASMWPRLFSRGDANPGNQCERSKNRFNVATAFQPWRFSFVTITPSL
jgi:hypothetical protein